MCHQNPSSSSSLALKFGTFKTIMSNYFQVFNSHVSESAGVADVATEDIWNNIKTGLLNTSELCGTTPSNHWHHETWWWNEHVEKAIAAKGKAFKAWKTGKGTRALYNAAKCISRHALHHAHKEANKKPVTTSISSNKKI